MKKQKQLESKSLSIFLFLFLFIMYAVVYMTKNMFSSAMATIVEQGVMTKSQTGLINAMFWLTYAVFQVIGGFASDKYSPYKIILIGLFGAAISNIIIYFNQSYPVIMITWIFNAIAQFGIWPGVFKVISSQIRKSIRSTAVFWMLFSTSVGLGFSMLLASFVKRWQQNFLVSAISLVVMAVLYIIINSVLEKKMVEVDEHPTVKDEENEQEPQKSPMLPLMLSSGLIAFMIVCLFRTAIDSGIKMMTPVMLMESYADLPAALSTRLSAILVIFSAIGTVFASTVIKRITGNEAKVQIILYTSSLLPILLVCFIGRVHYLWVLLALSLATLVIHGASPFNQSYASLRFDKENRVGTVSGILNAMASVGNVVASYVFALMAEYMPWGYVSASWLVAVVVCIAICVIVLPRWTKFIHRH